MAFNYDGPDFLSFAVYADVVARDERLFEANESLTEAKIDSMLASASQRILTQIKNTDWWKEYQYRRDTSLGADPRLVPQVNPDNILSKHQEFKDLNIYLAMYEYILPSIADFGNETSAEVVKMKHYKDAYYDMFKELIEDGSWYDFDADGTIQTGEKAPSRVKLVRVR